MNIRHVTCSLAMAPLVLAGLVAPGAGAASTPAPASARVEARAAEAWSTVSTGSVSLLAQPTMLRTADGALHVVYQQEAGTQQEYEHATISGPSAQVTARSKVLPPWGSLIADPQLLPSTTGMRLVFSGLQDTNTGNFFASGHMYNAVSDASGASWTVPAEGLTKSASAYASYGTSAAVLPDGTPIQGFPLNSGIAYRTGTIPASALGPGNTTPADSTFAQSACCAYHTSMSQTGGTVWMAWYGNGHTADSEGILVRQIHPTLGGLMVAPSSNRPTGSQFDSFAPDQAVPLVSRADGTTYAAYCIGTYQCERLVVWQVGTSNVREVPGGRGASGFAMDVTSSGRIWVAYVNDDEVYAVRSGPTGLRFGGVREAGRPRQSSDLYKIEVEATDDHADVVVNDGDVISHIRIDPALLLKASPRAWDGDRAREVTFKVTDATGGVSGVRIRGGGETCRTNSAGKCIIRYAPRRPGRIKVTAKKAGYAPAEVKLKVRR